MGGHEILDLARRGDIQAVAADEVGGEVMFCGVRTRVAVLRLGSVDGGRHDEGFQSRRLHAERNDLKTKPKGSGKVCTVDAGFQVVKKALQSGGWE